VETRNKNDGKRVYLNFCSSDKIDCLRQVKEEHGTNYSIPLSLSMKKQEDNCDVYDATFHPDTIQQAIVSQRFKQVIIELAIQQIQRSYQIEVNTSMYYCLYSIRTLTLL
jgi:hypothetical protein